MGGGLNLNRCYKADCRCIFKNLQLTSSSIVQSSSGGSSLETDYWNNLLIHRWEEYDPATERPGGPHRGHVRRQTNPRSTGVKARHGLLGGVSSRGYGQKQQKLDFSWGYKWHFYKDWRKEKVRFKYKDRESSFWFKKIIKSQFYNRSEIHLF